MKMYENKREITLKEALTILFTNNIPNINFEYMIFCNCSVQKYEEPHISYESV